MLISKRELSIFQIKGVFKSSKKLKSSVDIHLYFNFEIFGLIYIL